MKASIDDRNPPVCTVGDPAACRQCQLAGALKCRMNWSDLLHFAAISLLIAIPISIGLLRAGQGWVLLGWLGFSLFFFNVWESYILCRHCPFYAKSGRILHCIANYGMFKPFRFNPAPMSRIEKAQLLLGFALLFGIPLPFLAASGQWIMLLLAVYAGLVWLFTMQKYVCSTCINFSCPLNRVPKAQVDAYLKRNPVMQQAWEAHGWQVSADED